MFSRCNCSLGPDAHDFLGATMQVTIDTRHDTLEEALAVIQLAFAGASVPPQASSAAPRRTAKTNTVAKKSRSSKSAKAPTAPAPRRAPVGRKGGTSRV